MRTPKILKLLNEGKIEELKKQLEDEIYQDSLKTKPRRKTTLCSHVDDKLPVKYKLYKEKRNSDGKEA